MRRSRPRKSIWVAALALLVVAALALAACGGSGTTASDPSGAAASPSATATPDATALPTPTVPGTIAFVKMLHPAKGYNSDIYVVNTDGAGLKRLTDDPWWEEHPTWSPDGRRIAYELWRKVDDAHSSTIWVMGADGSGKAKLKSHGVHPEWSPDGTQIAFWTAEAKGDGLIYVMNADGSGVKPVAGGLSIQELNPAGYESGGGLGWTPDGKILFMKTTDKYGDVFAVNQDGSGLAQLTQGAELGTFSLSPDGARIALHDQPHRLYVAPVRGSAGEPATLLEQTYSYVFDVWACASWSPDGKALAFSTGSIDMMDGSPLYVINADGSGFSRVPGIPRAFDPAWRPQ